MKEAEKARFLYRNLQENVKYEKLAVEKKRNL